MKPYPKRAVYASGQQHHSFKLLEQTTHQSKGGNSFVAWNCQCDCGVVFATTTKQIKKGRKSCGCLSQRSQFKSISNEVALIRRKLCHYKIAAKRRNIKWCLKEQDFAKLLKQNCYYCGVEPCLEVKRFKGSIFVNGVDRVANDLDYTIDNVVSCCYICNRAKGDLDQATFSKWLERLRRSRPTPICHPS